MSFNTSGGARGNPQTPEAMCRRSGTLGVLADLHVLHDDSQVLLHGPVTLDAARPRTAWPDLSVDWLGVRPCRQREGGVNDLQGDEGWCWKDMDV